MDPTSNDSSTQTMGHGDQDDAFEIRPEAHNPTTFPAPFTTLQPPSISMNPYHRIRILHPYYPSPANELLTLFAPDTPAGGIEYGVVHAACGVISGNRWNGWFTTTKADKPALTLTYGDILRKGTYYFHLPGSSDDSPYAIVPTFQEWTFPHENLHPCWRENRNRGPSTQNRSANLSSFTEEIHFRDQSCRMSAYVEGTQAVHLCPKSEKDWFMRNGMWRYNLDPLRGGTKPLDDTANALLLRQDLRTHIEAHRFVFTPKKKRGDEEPCFVTHLLIASHEVGTLHHNMRLKPIPDVGIEFLFTRFAFAIFNFLDSFLGSGVERMLIGATISTAPLVPRNFDGAACRQFILRPKIQSQNPRKRLRQNSDNQDENEVDDSEDDTRTEVTVYNASQSTEASKNITPDAETDQITVLRNVWLEKERLRSDPQGAWLEEVAWADQIRDGNHVMGPADTRRLYRFWGFEEMEPEPDEEENVVS